MYRGWVRTLAPVIHYIVTVYDLESLIHSGAVSGAVRVGAWELQP